MSMVERLALMFLAPIIVILHACDAETNAPPGSSSAAIFPDIDADTRPRTSVLVFKSETCGCCEKWINHMRQAGFDIRVEHPGSLDGTKDRLGIPEEVRSCHTAVSPDGYVFEGHVPAAIVRRFLADAPEGSVGLAVPGMPIGSPGMEVGDRFEAYDVVLLHKDGSQGVYARVEGAEDQTH